MNHLATVQDPRRYPQSFAFVATRRRNTARTFRSAMRHSRVVRILRIAVPAAGVCAVLVVALIAWFDPLRLFGDIPIKVRDLVVSGTKITMEQPRLAGFTRDARPYELSARLASQDIARPQLVELSELHAKVQMQDRSVVEISAAKGLFDTKAEILTLDDNILVQSPSYKGRLQHAVINTRSGNLTSDDPVALKMLNTTIKANGLEIEQGGGLIRFLGGVSMTLMPNKDKVSAPRGAASK